MAVRVAVEVGIGVIVETGVKVAVGTGVEVGAAALQPSKEILLLISVMAPVLAKVLPEILTLLFMEMLDIAIILPAKLVLSLNVAELPICQKTLQGFTPLSICMAESLAVVRVLPI